MQKSSSVKSYGGSLRNDASWVVRFAAITAAILIATCLAVLFAPQIHVRISQAGGAASVTNASTTHGPASYNTQISDFNPSASILGMLGGNYTMSSSNTTIQPSSSSLWNDGYRSISTLLFTRNGKLANTSTNPSTAESTAYVMLNSTDAESLEAQIVRFFSYNLSISSQPISIVYQQNYSYGNANTTIYTEYTIVADDDATFVNDDNRYPSYQYLSVFSVNSTVIVVTVNGYPDLNASTSGDIAKLFFRHLLQYHIPSTPQININLTDVSSVIGAGNSYYTQRQNALTQTSGTVENNGFELVSTSEFNSTSNVSASSPYPQTISSVVIVTSNRTVAAQMEAGVFATAGINVTNSSLVHNSFGISKSAYSYKNATVGIDNLYAIARFNTTGAENYFNVLPIYQYTAMFTYNNVLGLVNLNGKQNISSNYSLALSKILFDRVIDAGIASPQS